jgi:hypothetical protein
MKDEFKFKLGEKVYWLGHQGICIVSGRGVMSFLSGGKLNMYQINGAHNMYLAEYELLTENEQERLARDGRL